MLVRQVEGLKKEKRKKKGFKEKKNIWIEREGKEEEKKKEKRLEGSVAFC